MKPFISYWLLALAFVAVAQAEDVFRYVDEHGQVYYSSKPRSAGDRPAALPEIAKENIKTRINNIKGDTPDSCDNHGGVDCSSGEDADGSVVCVDGFRSAELPYSMDCLVAKLKVDRFELVGTEGKAIKLSDKSAHARVEDLKGGRSMSVELTLRNISKIDAKGVTVSVYFPEMHESFEAEGSPEIAAFGAEDYTLPLSMVSNRVSDILTFGQLKSRYKVYCANCRGALSGLNY